MLVLQLFKLPHVVDFQPQVLLLPAIESLFGNSYPPDHFGYRHTQLRLLQNAHDLLNRKALLLHSLGKFLFGRICRKLALQLE